MTDQDTKVNIWQWAALEKETLAMFVLIVEWLEWWQKFGYLYGLDLLDDPDAKPTIVAMRQLKTRVTGVAMCEECGCTEDAACPGGCTWIRPGLCSDCEDSAPPEPPGGGP